MAINFHDLAVAKNHLAALPAHARERRTAQLLAAMVAEVERLRAIEQRSHEQYIDDNIRASYDPSYYRGRIT